MAYNRYYSLQEVVVILSASEHRVRPGGGSRGHAISRHTLERQDKFSRPGHLPQADSTFLVDKNCLSEMVREALNSPLGQKELEKLNGEKSTVAIRSVILRQGGNFDIFAVYRPREGQSSFDWASAAKGDGYIIQILVIIDKIPNSKADIHIHTAYPEDFARTQGDTILRATPRPGSHDHRHGSKAASSQI
jgi:hypothetical protein